MHHPQYLCPQPFTLCSRLLRVLQVLVRFPLPCRRFSSLDLQFILRILSLIFCINLFGILSYHLPLYPAVQLDVLAVVVDVVAGVVDVQGHVLVLQVLLQPALVRLTATQLLVHLQKYPIWHRSAKPAKLVKTCNKKSLIFPCWVLIVSTSFSRATSTQSRTFPSMIESL